MISTNDKVCADSVLFIPYRYWPGLRRVMNKSLHLWNLLSSCSFSSQMPLSASGRSVGTFVLL